MMMFGFLFLIGPGLIGLVALAAAVWLGMLGTRDDFSITWRIILWCAAALCASVVFGIGSCYAMVFGGGLNIH